MKYLHNYFTITVFVFSLVSASIATAQEEPLRKWLQTHKLRVGYGVSRPGKLFDYADLAGMNAVMNRCSIEAAMMDAAQCKKNNLKFFYVAGIACSKDEYETGFKNNPRRFHNGKIPCPLDKVYWQRVIIDRAVELAGKLTAPNYRLDAFVIDPEMYCFSGATPSLPCVCDDCWAETLPKVSKPKNLPISKRKAWLKKHKLLDAYIQDQASRVEGMGRDLVRELHKIRPDVPVGWMIYRLNNAYYPAMAKGLASDKTPVLILAESTYGGNYDKAFHRWLRAIRASLPKNHILCPGVALMLFDDKIPHEFLTIVPGNIYHRSTVTDGYWVYAFYRFKKPEYRPPFLKAIKTLNGELDKLAANPEYKSPLKAQPVPIAMPDNWQDLLLAARHWTPIQKTDMPIPKEKKKLGRARGDRNLIIITDKKYDKIDFDIKKEALGSHIGSSQWLLYDRDGEELAQGILQDEEKKSYSVPGNGKHIYLLCVKAAATYIDVKNPNAVYAQNRLHDHEVGGKYYFYVSPEQKDLKFELYGWPKEPASYRICDNNQAIVLNERNLKKNKIVTIPVKESQAGVWSVEIFDLVDDGDIKLLNMEGRFAVTPEQLMIEE